jgi:hypothetical protein
MDSNEFAAKRLEIVLVSLVGILQVFQDGWSFYLNRQTAEKIDEVKRVQDISDKILESEPVIAGGNPARAKVVLGALYVRAFSDDDKEDLARIAVLSDKTELRNAISYIIRTDSQSTPALAQRLNKVFSPIAAQQVDEATAEANAAESGVEMNKSSSELAKKDSPIKPTPEIKAAAALAAKTGQSTEGWIYLGTADTTKPGTRINERTTTTMIVPVGDVDTTLNTFVALREKGTTLQGNVKTVLPPGNQLRVRGVSPRRLASGGYAIWASVISQ